MVSLFDVPKKSKAGFMFFNMWCEHELFIGVVERCWSMPVVGTKHYILCHKLKLLKKSFKELTGDTMDIFLLRQNQ